MVIIYKHPVGLARHVLKRCTPVPHKKLWGDRNYWLTLKRRNNGTQKKRKRVIENRQQSKLKGEKRKTIVIVKVAFILFYFLQISAWWLNRHRGVNHKHVPYKIVFFPTITTSPAVTTLWMTCIGVVRNSTRRLTRRVWHPVVQSLNYWGWRWVSEGYKKNE